MIDDNNPHQMIQVEICDYINQKMKVLEDKIRTSEERNELKLKALAAEYAKSETLLEETKKELDKRLEEMNNFRSQLGKQAMTFLTDDDVDSKITLAMANQKIGFGLELPNMKTQLRAIWVILTMTLGLIGTVIAAHLMGKV